MLMILFPVLRIFISSNANCYLNTRFFSELVVSDIVFIFRYRIPRSSFMIGVRYQGFLSISYVSFRYFESLGIDDMTCSCLFSSDILLVISFLSSSFRFLFLISSSRYSGLFLTYLTRRDTV